MPYPASIFERQRQLSTSLSTSRPSQSKMMRSGWVIAGFPSRSEHILKKWAITQAARGGDQLNLSEGPPVALKPALGFFGDACLFDTALDRDVADGTGNVVGA